MHFTARRIGDGFLITALVALAVFCCAYLAADYDGAARWYHSLGKCLYRGGEWTTKFFTPATKRAGNAACGLALLAIVVFLRSLVLGWRAAGSRNREAVRSKDGVSSWIIPAGVATAAVALGLWSARRHSPATDEVFSWLYSAAAHPFQTLSYYMLPNNHVLFNLANSVLCRTGADGVWMGRWISIASYALLLVVAYRWVLRTTDDRVAAVATVAVLAVQAPLWGFAGQARGYALNALAHWMAFVSLHRYGEDGERRHLRAYALASVLGYATVPTFLYMHAGGALWAAVHSIRRRRFDGAFWWSQAAGAVGAALFYTPLVCFSGLKALTGNSWVAPGQDSLLSFIGRAKGNVLGYDNHAFGGDGQTVIGISSVLMAAPLILIILRAPKPVRRAAWIAVAMWVAAFAVMLAMKNDPFHRNLVGYFSITAAVSLLAVRQLLLTMARGKRLLASVVFVLMCVGQGVRNVRWFLREMPEQLYYFDNNLQWTLITGPLQALPAGATVHTSGEAFMAHYILQQRGLAATHCFDEMAPAHYHIRKSEEPPMPAEIAARYELVRDTAGMRFYRLKR